SKLVPRFAWRLFARDMGALVRARLPLRCRHRGGPMKLSLRLDRWRRKKAAHDAAPTPAAGSILPAPSTLVLLGLALALAGVATLFAFERFIWTKVPPELVGLWEVNEGPQKGGTFEFFRDGVMEVNLVAAKKKRITHKTPVVVNDKTIQIAASGPFGGADA